LARDRIEKEKVFKGFWPFDCRIPAINPVRQDKVVDGLFFANPRQLTVKQKK
jgi:hypothetical protein